MRPDRDPNPLQPTMHEAVPNADRAHGYLLDMLADGARPFLYRGRVRHLLGLPEADGVQVTFVSTMLMPGFAYTRPRAEVAFIDEPVDLLRSVTQEFDLAVDLGMPNRAPRQVPGPTIAPPGIANPTPSATRAEASEPIHSGVGEIARLNQLGEGHPEEASPQVAPPESPTPISPMPSLTSLTLPAARPLPLRPSHAPRPVPQPEPPHARSSAPPDAGPSKESTTPRAVPMPQPHTAPPPTVLPQMASAPGRELDALTPTVSRTPDMPTANRWPPARVSAAPAPTPQAAAPANRAARADQPIPAATDSAAQSTHPPAQAVAGPVADHPLALPYMGVSSRGATGVGAKAGGRNRQQPVDEPTVGDWPTPSRPGPAPAPQVVVVSAPASYGRQPTAAFWERSHRRRLPMRPLR